MKILKKILKIIGWFLLGIILLVVIVLVAIQTSPVKEQIVKIAEKQVNNLLNAELSVGELTGNFFTHLGLNDVLLVSDKKDTIAYIERLNLKYKLLPLLKSKIDVEEVIIDRPYVFLEQFSDSTWNLQYITKPSDKEKDTLPVNFNMLVNLERFNLNSGTVKIIAMDSIIPENINDLYIGLSGHYSTNDQKADLTEFRFITHNPDLEVKKLNIKAKGNKDLIDLEELLLETKLNSLFAKGEYAFNKKERSQIELDTEPLKLEEIRFLLPDDFELQAEPVVNINAELEAEKLSLKLKLFDKDQGLDLNLLSYYLIEYFGGDTSLNVNYNLALNINKVDLRYWLNNPDLKYIIDGNLNANGEGVVPETLKTHLKGEFKDILVYEYPMSKLDLELDYDAGNVDGDIRGSGNFGYVYLQPDVRQLLSNNPRYFVSLVARNFNLEPILKNQDYRSDINLNAKIDGSSFNLDRIRVKGEIEAFPSTVIGIKLDTLNTAVEFAQQNIIIDTLFLKTFSTSVAANGNYSLKGDSDIRLIANVENAEELTKLINLDSLSTSVVLNAHLYGTTNDLTGDLMLGLGKTQYKELAYVDSVAINANATIRDKDININGKLETDKLIVSGIDLDKVVLNAKTDTKDITLDLDVMGPDIQTQMDGMVSLGETIKIALENLWLGYKGYNWQLDSDTAYIQIGSDEYVVDNFHLKSGDMDSVQYVNIDGKINRIGEQDLKLEIKDLDIAQVVRLFSEDTIIKGILNFDLGVNGTAEQPDINGELNLIGLTVQNYRFNLFKGDILYNNNLMNLDLSATPESNGEFLVSGKLPMNIRLDSMLFEVSPKLTDPIYARALIGNLPLSVLGVFLPVDETSGLINADILAEGTLGEPNLNGNLDIKDGLISWYKFGINYSDIQADINFDSESVRIDTFLIKSNDGNMQMKGGAQFASELYKGELSSSDIKILFNRFNPIDHRQYNMELSGEIDLNTNKDSLLFSGDLEIPEMQVYLPAVLALLGRSLPKDMPSPLLIVELEKENIHADSVVYTVRLDTTASDTASKLEFLNNLQGNLRVKIPRNTWIRNDDFRVELSGDVELVKHQSFFELFGSIDVVRGQYNLLGKVFVVKSGTVTFQGGEEINPLLDVEATYTFRDANRTSKELQLKVTGEAFSPELSFSLDDQQISEGDALSYIIFGTSMDALASGQQESLNSGMDAAGIAGTVASSLISSQLTKFLGNTLNVDYIEFSSSSSFDNASLTVGKYITNKLFVSYEQTIGNIQDEDLPRYEMSMEYEVFKFLFLQLTSSPITNGFDVIFKFNSK